MRAFAVLLLLFVVTFILLFAFSTTPVVTLPGSINAIGQATPLSVTIADPHGLRRATAYIEQNAERHKLAEIEQPSRRFHWLRSAPAETLYFTAGIKSTPQLKDGSARLIVEAVSNDFRGKMVTAERDVTVATQPVRVSVD